MSKEPGFSTTAVHAGESRQKVGDGITDAIVPATAFTFKNTKAILNFLENSEERDEYVRYSNPNQRTVEKKLAELDGGEASLLFSSGMSAITTLFLAKLSEGDEIIVFDECYHRTRQFCVEHLGRFKIVSKRVPMGDYSALEKAITKNTKLIFSESPTNPHLSIVDLKRLRKIADLHNIEIAIDTTIATPINYQPIKEGADYVIHSATKYLGGHNDVLAGVLTGKEDKISSIRDLRGLLGSVPAAHTCYELQKGLKTLSLRIERQNQNGLKIAQFLESHPKVSKVYYPGLKSHPYYDLAQKTQSGFGGLVTFIIKGSPETASKFVDSVTVPRIGPSLGGVESLIEQPYIMSYFKLSKDDRQKVGIDDSMIRFSSGIEDVDDLIADFKQALEKI